MKLFTCFSILLTINSVVGWDSEELELFDLVEEINENFYDVLGVAKDAGSSEIKKAYRKKTLVLHPDKNEAPDAEEKFRKLVAVYEVLKDENKRERYNHILQHGLPDWRQPIFYYRRVRKMGVAELSVLLCIIITIGHYLVLWAVYLEKRLALEDFFSSKKKREKKGKRRAVNEEIDEMMITTLDAIPKPRLLDLWPVTLTLFIIRSVRSVPAYVRRKEEKRLREEMMRLMKEEEERLARERQEYELKRQEKKKHKQEKPKGPTADLVKGTPVIYGLTDQKDRDDTEEEDNLKQTVKAGNWTDEDYVMLSKAYIRFPGGTQNRWEKIADMVGRPVSEVTNKCKQMKGNFTMNLSSSVQGSNPKTSKKNIAISDSIISHPDTEAEIIGAKENNSVDNTENKVRKRTRHKPADNSERTLMISKIPVSAGKQTGTSSKSQTGSLTSDNKNVTGSNKSADNSSSVASENTNQSSDKLVNNNGAENNAKSVISKQSQAKTSTNSANKDSADGDVWSQNQQVILEWALRQYPKTTEQRWEKIAEHIPGKNKDDCIARFKYLAEIVKQRKQQQAS